MIRETWSRRQFPSMVFIMPPWHLTEVKDDTATDEFWSGSTTSADYCQLSEGWSWKLVPGVPEFTSLDCTTEWHTRSFDMKETVLGLLFFSPFFCLFCLFHCLLEGRCCFVCFLLLLLLLLLMFYFFLCVCVCMCVCVCVCVCVCLQKTKLFIYSWSAKFQFVGSPLLLLFLSPFSFRSFFLSFNFLLLLF